jgi:hypothetical protein
MPKYPQTQGILNKYDIKQSLLFDTEQFSLNSEDSFQGWNAHKVNAWVSRLLVLGARIYPIVIYDDGQLQEYKFHKTRLMRIEFKNVEEMREEGLLFLEFILKTILKIGIYNSPDIETEQEVTEADYAHP